MAEAATGTGSRRAAVRRELAAGDVASIRDLASRLQAEGVDVTPEALRSDVRALGAIRVQHGDGTVLALGCGQGLSDRFLVGDVAGEMQAPGRCGRHDIPDDGNDAVLLQPLGYRGADTLGAAGDDGDPPLCHGGVSRASR